ncbi:MAG: hypothetical protein PGN09_05920, partial [Sphingomonas fennica]
PTGRPRRRRQASPPNMGASGRRAAEAYLSGPLGRDLAARVSGFVEQGGGFQRDRATGEPLGDADRLFGRALLRWAPGTAEVTLNVHGGRDRSEQTGLVLFDAFPTRGYGATPAGPVIPADLTRRATGWGFQARLPRADRLRGGQPAAARQRQPGREPDGGGGCRTAAADEHQRGRASEAAGNWPTGMPAPRANPMSSGAAT